MPAPIVLDVSVRGEAAPRRVTVPVDVWFDGRRTYEVGIDTRLSGIERIVLDPGCRSPDRDSNDNVWPRSGPPPCGRRN